MGESLPLLSQISGYTGTCMRSVKVVVGPGPGPRQENRQTLQLYIYIYIVWM